MNCNRFSGRSIGSYGLVVQLPHGLRHSKHVHRNVAHGVFAVSVCICGLCVQHGMPHTIHTLYHFSHEIVRCVRVLCVCVCCMCACARACMCVFPCVRIGLLVWYVWLHMIVTDINQSKITEIQIETRWNRFYCT